MSWKIQKHLNSSTFENTINEPVIKELTVSKRVFIDFLKNLKLDIEYFCFRWLHLLNFNKKFLIAQRSFSRYNDDFFRKIKLKYIVLCSELEIGGIPALGFANPEMKTLILNINTNNTEFERVLHHEVFHIINDSFKEIFNEKTWSSFNSDSFNYAKCSTCTKKIGLDTYSKTDGFITEYSKSTASEDMAEVFSHLMHGNLPKQIDPILQKKIDFIKSGLLKIDQNFDL